ncbi:MAG: hypothetical protein JWN46_2186 [Acidimicrobiales bacterium]|nr:hypothetical protein [Acidimicrobiales bacterium]
MADWLDELVLRAEGPPWLSMGLGRIDEERWLVADERRPAELALRADLLDRRHGEVFAALAGTQDAGAEVLDLVRSWLARRGLPDTVSEPDDRDVHAHPRHPLEVAGRLVQEDLVLMVPRDGAFHLDAACLCFPSHWRLADKLGGSAAAIHEPVPRYDVELAPRVDRYLERLRPDTISARRNWSVHDAPDLFAPVRLAPAARLSGDEVALGLWLRSERQTLRRLTTSAAVLFTIRVQQVPFGTLAERPEVAQRFLDRLVAQPAALTEMNGLAPHRDAVVAWLRRLLA